MIRALAVLLLVAAGATADPPQRPSVVSLDYCADQFVLGLADREQILAVSTGADKPHSHLREAAAGIRQVRSSTEDVIALNPDLVIYNWGADAKALAMYQRFGIRTHQIGFGNTIESAAEETRAAAAALGHPERGEARAVAMAPAQRPLDLAALYVTPGGLTAGDATMVGAIMRHAGLTNAAGAGYWKALPLEQLVLAPPQIALTAFFGFDTDQQDNWSATRHPVMRRTLAGAQQIALTESRLICPAWFVVDEAVALAEALK